MTQELFTIGFRGTAAYRKLVQQEALNRSIKVQRFIEQAVSYYLRGVPGYDGVTPDEQQWLAAMLTFLREDTYPQKEYVTDLLAAALGVDPRRRVRNRQSRLAADRTVAAESPNHIPGGGPSSMVDGLPSNETQDSTTAPNTCHPDSATEASLA
jgi:hypothetical protein